VTTCRRTARKQDPSKCHTYKLYAPTRKRSSQRAGINGFPVYLSDLKTGFKSLIFMQEDDKMEPSNL
jgi:hypothetical protein